MTLRFRMLAGILSLMVIVSAVVSGISQSNENGRIVARTDYVFAPFDQVDGLSKIVSKADYERAVADKRFRMEELKYLSDGLTVSAYLYSPRVTAGKNFPVIVFNRGGYIRGDIGSELVAFFNRLASSGFVVFAPLYRGSNGAPGNDEVGGADVNDLMNTLPVLKSLDFVDTGNIFMYGESRGGMMTFQAMRNGYPINAAASFGGFTDFDALVNERPDLYQPLIDAIWPNYKAQKNAIADKRSAVKWADKLNSPLLLMHGGADRSVDPVQTLKLAQLLQKARKSYELIIYNGDDHTLSKNRKDRDERAIAWFAKHLKAGQNSKN